MQRSIAARLTGPLRCVSTHAASLIHAVGVFPSPAAAVAALAPVPTHSACSAAPFPSCTAPLGPALPPSACVYGPTRATLTPSTSSADNDGVCAASSLLAPAYLTPAASAARRAAPTVHAASRAAPLHAQSSFIIRSSLSFALASHLRFYSSSSGNGARSTGRPGFNPAASRPRGAHPVIPAAGGHTPGPGAGYLLVTGLPPTVTGAAFEAFIRAAAPAATHVQLALPPRPLQMTRPPPPAFAGSSAVAAAVSASVAPPAETGSDAAAAAAAASTPVPASAPAPAAHPRQAPHAHSGTSFLTVTTVTPATVTAAATPAQAATVAAAAANAVVEFPSLTHAAHARASLLASAHLLAASTTSAPIPGAAPTAAGAAFSLDVQIYTPSSAAAAAQLEKQSRRPARGVPIEERRWAILISGIPEGHEWQEVKDLCRGFGEVAHTRTFRPRQYTGHTFSAITRFATQAGYEGALKGLHGAEYHGHTLTVVPFRHRQELDEAVRVSAEALGVEAGAHWVDFNALPPPPQNGSSGSSSSSGHNGGSKLSPQQLLEQQAAGARAHFASNGSSGGSGGSGSGADRRGDDRRRDANRGMGGKMSDFM